MSSTGLSSQDRVKVMKYYSRLVTKGEKKEVIAVKLQQYTLELKEGQRFEK